MRRFAFPMPEFISASAAGIAETALLLTTCAAFFAFHRNLFEQIGTFK